MIETNCNGISSTPKRLTLRILFLLEKQQQPLASGKVVF
jgi:hypothetical protein